jgi:hypothetical protein
MNMISLWSRIDIVELKNMFIFIEFYYWFISQN